MFKVYLYLSLALNLILGLVLIIFFQIYTQGLRDLQIEVPLDDVPEFTGDIKRNLEHFRKEASPFLPNPNAYYIHAVHETDKSFVVEFNHVHSVLREVKIVSPSFLENIFDGFHVDYFHQTSFVFSKDNLELIPERKGDSQ